jgi:hypothetical protein
MILARTVRVRASVLIGWWLFVGCWIIADQQFVERCDLLRCGWGPTIPYLGPVRLIVLGLFGSATLLLWWSLPRERRPLDIAEQRTRRWIVWSGAVIGVVAAAHLFLLSPLDGGMRCSDPVRLGPHVGYVVNCDTWLFADLAHQPALLLTPGNPRQNRPGYVVLSAAVTAVLAPAAEQLGLNAFYHETETAFVPLLVLNLAIAATAVALLALLLLRLGAPPVVTALLCTLVAVNPLTKAYFWSPHQQMFVLLTPVVSVLLGRALLLRRPSWPGLLLVGLSLGVGLLVYGNVLVAVGTAAVALLLPGPGDQRPRMLRRAAQATIILFASALPTVSWIAVCIAVAGSYNNQEVTVYHQFVWLPEAAVQGIGDLMRALGSATGQTTGQLVEVTWPFAVLLLLMLVAARIAGVSLAPRTPEQRATLIALGLTTAMSLALLWGIGLWAFRVTYTVLPLYLIAIGWVAAHLVRIRPRWTVAALIGLVIAWVTVMVLMTGPYS